MSLAVTKSNNKKLDSKFVLLYLGIASMIMLFTSLASALLVKRGDFAHWEHVDIPTSFLYSTIVIILSSVTLEIANRNAEIDTKKTKQSLIATLILAFLFVALQLNGWNELKAHGVMLQGNPSGSFIYVISLVHGLHYVLGIAFLLRFIYRYDRNNNNFQTHSQSSISVLTQYWHFIGLIWVFIYLFFKFVIYN